MNASRQENTTGDPKQFSLVDAGVLFQDTTYLPDHIRIGFFFEFLGPLGKIQLKLVYLDSKRNILTLYKYN